MNKSIPDITVLMPVYNGEKFLAQAIDSIFNQRFDNFEFLIIDDCSKDKSRDIIRLYEDKRLRFIENHKNLGQSKTMNRGIELANAKYIARIDQDDLSHPERLQKQMEYIESSRCSIVGTWANTIDNNGELYGYVQHPVEHEHIANSLGISCSLSHSSVLMKRDDIRSVGCYSEDYRVAMDWHLWLKAANHGLIFGNIPEYLVSLRQHRNQTMKNKAGLIALHNEHLRLLRYAREFIKIKSYMNASQGWEYHYNLMLSYQNLGEPKKLMPFLAGLFSFKGLYEYIRLVLFYKIIKKPELLCPPPIKHIKAN